MAPDLVKIVLVGDGAVGKTAALLSFALLYYTLPCSTLLSYGLI